tara:strand:+ start:139 stop:1311 length:1173 start_codon:yes stop_codon:yes gene_type:complete
MKKLKILIIGGGMYVSGRGTDNYGTIIPALLTAKKKGLIEEVFIATTSSKTAHSAYVTLKKISKLMQVKLKCGYIPKIKSNVFAYKEALKIFDPDAVIISVPDHLHSKICLDVLSHKKHCLIAKPMAPTYKEGLKMLKASKKAGVVAQVEFHKRLDESNILLKESIYKKKIGTPLYVTIEYSQQKKIPEKFFKKWSSKTNIFAYLGVHYVDLLYFLTEYKPRSITAWGQKEYLIKKGIDTYDSMQVVIEWQNNKNKFISSHITNWIDSNKSTALSDQKINFVGTKGRYQADQKNRGISLVTDFDGPKSLNPYFSSSFSFSRETPISFNGYGINNINQFLLDIIQYKEGKITLKQLDKSRPTFKSSIISTAVLDAAYKSLKNNNKKIKINL